MSVIHQNVYMFDKTLKENILLGKNFNDEELNLDSKTAFEIEDTLLNIDDLTVITITHKLIDNILGRYDEIIVMDNGKIVEQGSFSEFMDKQGEFYELYSVEGDAV